jgi:hypothetical protein
VSPVRGCFLRSAVAEERLIGLSVCPCELRVQQCHKSKTTDWIFIQFGIEVVPLQASQNL